MCIESAGMQSRITVDSRAPLHLVREIAFVRVPYSMLSRYIPLASSKAKFPAAA